MQRIVFVLLALLFWGIFAEAKCGSQSRKTQPLSQELIDTIAKVRQEAGPSSARTRHAEHLSELTRSVCPDEVDDKTLENLVSLLDTSDDSVRAWVAGALGHLGSRAKVAGPKLLEVLLEVECIQLVGGLTSEGAIRTALKRIGVTPPRYRRCDPAKGRLGSQIPGAAPQPRATQATPRDDENSRLAHFDLLKKANSGRIDVYFEGDSIVRRWGATDYPELLKNWQRNFFGWNAANFGWGADKTENILWRLEDGELDGVNPKVIVLLAGTNDVGDATGPGNSGDLAAQVTDSIQAILRVMQSKAPESRIILMGIFPRNDNLKLMPIINQINGKLSSLADGKKVRYLNINDKLADENGRLYDGMMNADKLHPTAKAYQVWADELKPIFTELLGPAQEVDHAPPPTGDPSVRGRSN